MAAAVEHILPDLLDDSRVLVLKQEIPPLVITQPTLALREDMSGIAPNEVGGEAIGDDDSQVAAIHVRGAQSRQVPAGRLRPTMQQNEPLSVWAA